MRSRRQALDARTPNGIAHNDYQVLTVTASNGTSTWIGLLSAPHTTLIGWIDPYNLVDRFDNRIREFPPRNHHPARPIGKEKEKRVATIREGKRAKDTKAIAGMKNSNRTTIRTRCRSCFKTCELVPEPRIDDRRSLKRTKQMTTLGRELMLKKADRGRRRPSLRKIQSRSPFLKS